MNGRRAKIEAKWNMEENYYNKTDNNINSGNAYDRVESNLFCELRRTERCSGVHFLMIKGYQPESVIVIRKIHWS
jgi:hypothetical protein